MKLSISGIFLLIGILIFIPGIQTINGNAVFINYDFKKTGEKNPLSTNGLTDTLEYISSNYNEVIEDASKNNKMIFIDFYTVWCGGCKYFEKIIKHNALFRAFINKYFCSLQINAELEQNKAIVSKYNPNGYPTFIITNSKGDEIGRIVGIKEKVPEKFIRLIEQVMNGKEDLDLLKQQYVLSPDSLLLFKKIVWEKMIEKELYKSAIEFAEYAIVKSNNSALIREAKFYKAYASIKDQIIPSPNDMIDFIKEEINNKHFVEWGYSELYYYYRNKNISDSIEYYLTKLISLNSGNHLVYVRDYARFLYKHNINISLANQLTGEYSGAEGNQADHWTPYLNAHKLAHQGKFEEGIKIFDDWMLEYCKPGNINDEYWQYIFYVDFMLFYNKSSKEAIKYALILEKHNPDISNKMQLAELYYLNREASQAIKKLKEIKSLLEDPKQKKEIDDLIKTYSVKQL